MSSPLILGSSLTYDLTRGYGNNAQDIYDECCKRFGWDASSRHAFGSRSSLFEKNVTPEGYSVWFICHSNWTHTQSGVWKNSIHEDKISEYWLVVGPEIWRDDTTRVVFAKTPSNGYAFMGIYKPIQVEERKFSTENKYWLKTYQRISNNYPKTK